LVVTDIFYLPKPHFVSHKIIQNTSGACIGLGDEEGEQALPGKMDNSIPGKSQMARTGQRTSMYRWRNVHRVGYFVFFQI